MENRSIATKLRHLFSAHDMTQGAPWKRIAEFAIPMLIGNLAQQLYNTADSIIVGHYVGDNALAAVGSASPILNLLLALFVGVATGVGILVSQRFGAKDHEQLSVVIGNCITLSAIVSVITCALGLLITRPMLELLKTPASIIDWCDSYLSIYFIGIAGFAYYNILSGILRGLGDSVSALGFLLVSAALNVALDLYFVGSLRMGVAGVALATVLAQSFSAVLCMWKLMRMHDIFRLQWHHLKPHGPVLSSIIRIGIPSGITQAIFSMSMIVVQSLTNSFGELVIACNVIVMRVDGFAMMPNFTFGQAMTTYTGQNVGAHRLDRVHSGAKQGTIISVSISAALTVLILLFGRGLMSIFTQTTQLVDLGMRMMRILACGYIAMSVTQCLSGVMRGAGDTMTPMWISIISTTVLRVPMAYAIAYFTRSAEYPTGRPESTFISLLIAWMLGAGITVFAYRFGHWRQRMEQIAADEPAFES